ncbi:MAG: glycosyltransferase [Mucilaginibacter sp.]|uniref:glycosyltransferase n=1 Tax=Mucilaginibacter sp. TaxID=1882438 RepID=UPI0032678A65
MKIAFVSTMVSDSWGGSEELWKGTALVLREKGYNIFVNVKEWPEKPKQLIELEAAGCIVERRKYYIQPSIWQKISKKIRLSEKAGGYYDKAAYLKGVNADIAVICQGSNQDGLDWMETCMQVGQKFATISQAATEALWPQDATADRLGMAFTASKMNYFISQNNLKLTIKQTARSYSNAKVVRNTFNVSYNSDLSYPISSGQYNLACVGRVQPDAKGQDILFEVLARDKWKSRPLKINIYGKGPNINSLKKLAQLWDIVNVVFHGHVANVTQIWEDNQGLILPSRYEGLPLAVVEASLCGRISIVTDVAGNTEVIKDGITGFIAKAPNAELLDEAMENAWAKRDEWQQMGNLAKEYIKQHVPEKPEQVFAEELISLI